MWSIDDLFTLHGPSYRWLATATVMISTVAVVLSTTIVNVAIPDVMGAFGISQVQAQWISTGFLAAMTTTMLLTDWTEKAFGHRATMIGALSLFMAGSILGGIARNEDVLTIARVIQGASAGVVQPLAMMLLFQVFPLDQRGAAMGIYGVGVVLAPALGPWIGGLLIDTFSWHYVFFLGIPFAIVGIAMSNLFLPTRAQKGPRPRLDWGGLVLLCIFLATLLNGLTNAQRNGWDSGPILLQFGVSIVAAIVFVWWEMRADKPMLDMRLFANPPFAAASVVAFIMGAGLFGSIYLVPLFVQTIQGLTPTQAGLLLMPAGFVLVLAFPIAGRLSDRMPAGYLIVGGMIVFAYSSWLTASIGIDTAFWTIAWWTLLSRVGLGFVFPSLTAASLKVLPASLVGQGSGAGNFMRQLGGAFGVNLLAVFLERRTMFHADVLTATQTGDNPQTMALLVDVARIASTAGVPDVQQMPVALHFLGQAIHLQAETLAFRDGFLVITLVFVVGLVPSWILHRALRRR